MEEIPKISNAGLWSFSQYAAFFHEAARPLILYALQVYVESSGETAQGSGKISEAYCRSSPSREEPSLEGEYSPAVRDLSITVRGLSLIAQGHTQEALTIQAEDLSIEKALDQGFDLFIKKKTGISSVLPLGRLILSLIDRNSMIHADLGLDMVSQWIRYNLALGISPDPKP